MKDLFDQGGSKKIIEGDFGELEYIEDFLSYSQAETYFTSINEESPWERPILTYFGEEHRIPRDTAWYGEKSYVYSGVRNKPNQMTESLIELRKITEEKCSYSFNSLLINRYLDGDDKVSWHADDEAELENCNIIASISLGAGRDFRIRKKENFRNPEDKTIKIFLEPGSLLIMKAPLQKFWEHEIPKRTNVGPRLNLTFRNVI